VTFDQEGLGEAADQLGQQRTEIADLADCGQHQQELVASLATQGVRLAHVLQQPGGHAAQQRITDLVAERVVDGLELGDNAKAGYLTRSLHELVRIGTALGGEAQTFYGLTGLGDLIATASSPLSRNHRLGQAIARGTSLKDFTESTKMVVEGVEAAKIASEWGKKLTLQLPITEELCRVLFDGRPPDIAAANLMGRSLKAETD